MNKLKKKPNRQVGVLLGLILVLVCNVLFVGLIFSLFFSVFLSIATRGADFGSVEWLIQGLCTGIGLSQLLYVIPMGLWTSWYRYFGMREGIILGAGTTLFLNIFWVLGSYFGS